MSTQEVKNKSDEALAELLNDKDSDTRFVCILALSYRFQNPDAPLIMAPAVAEPAHSRRIPLPNGLVEKTATLARSDNDLRVRLAAVRALSSFKFHTNTTPVLTTLLEDKCCIIRIRAAQALIGFMDEYHEPISDQVVQVLIDCLNPTNSPDVIWQAAETLGDLGSRAKEALPFLKQLQQHESPQVRQYANEAAVKIQKKSKRDKSRTP